MEPQIAFAATEPSECRRRICTGGCERPENVCLCDKLPAQPISTATQIVILQHPHEQRHKLATVPVLGKCLKNCEIVVGRKLRVGSSSLLDSLFNQAQPGQPHRAIFLFPGIFISFLGCHLTWALLLALVFGLYAELYED